MRSQRVCVGVAVGLAVASCGEPLSPGAAVDVKVAAVAVGNPTLVTFTVANTSNREVLVARCGPRIVAEVDQALGPSWRLWSTPSCDADQTMADLLVAAGATLSSDWPVDGHGRFRLRPAVRWGTTSDYDWTATSNSFDIP